MMEINPIKVTLLKHGAFQEYYKAKQESGADLARRKPPRMNASEEIISELVNMGNKSAVYVG